MARGAGLSKAHGLDASTGEIRPDICLVAVIYAAGRTFAWCETGTRMGEGSPDLRCAARRIAETDTD